MINNVKDLNVVMQAHHLIEYSDDYSKRSGGLWQYCKDEPDDNITDSRLF